MTALRGLVEVLPTLARSKRAMESLANKIGRENVPAAIEMMRAGKLTGPLGDDIDDFFSDEIINEGRSVWEGVIYDESDRDNPDKMFGVGIQCYEGVYVPWAVDYGYVECFLSLEEAEAFVRGNWDAVRQTSRKKRAKAKRAP